MRQFQLYLQKGKQRSGRHSNPVSRQQMCQNNAVRKAYRNLGGKWEMGQESECLNVRCAKKMTRGVAGKGIRSKGCRGAEQGHTCT
jgi:hypothetical protein